MAATKMNNDQLPLIPNNGAIKISNKGRAHPTSIISVCFHFI